MAIRAATACDLPAIRECAQEAYSKYVARIGKSPAPMIADFEQQIRNKVLFVAADASERIQGFIVFYRRNDHMHLENVAVCSQHQGKGIGRTLIEYCETKTRDAQLTAVELYTNEKMAENLTLYPRLGYREIGRRSEDGFDRVFFAKTL